MPLSSRATPPHEPGPPLKLRRIGVHTFGENVAFLSAHCPYYAPETFVSFNKVEVHGNGRRLVASLNIVANGDLMDAQSLGLSQSTFDDFGLPEGADVTLTLAMPARSLEAVRRKILGDTLTADELLEIIGVMAQSATGIISPRPPLDRNGRQGQTKTVNPNPFRALGLV